MSTPYGKNENKETAPINNNIIIPAKRNRFPVLPVFGFPVTLHSINLLTPIRPQATPRNIPITNKE